MKHTDLLKQKILQLVQQEPGLSAPEIGERLDISRISAFRHLKILLTLQEIRTNGRKNATRYFPHELQSLRIRTSRQSSILSLDQVRIFREELVFAFVDQYGEEQSWEGIEHTFQRYCMYIDAQDIILTGFEAFLAWCHDPKHDFRDRIIEKAMEYLEIVGSIEYRRKKHGFLDGSESARANLAGEMEIGFDTFLFAMPSVFENGFGHTRTAVSLYYGKLGHRHLLEQAIEGHIDRIVGYSISQKVDGLVFTPPSQGRSVQFRDILRSKLSLNLPEISAEKIPTLGRILQPQKLIRDRAERIRNASTSLQMTTPDYITTYQHILILDDSFTTGATPNAIAVRLRETGYAGQITIITICGSFRYDLAISEVEI